MKGMHKFKIFPNKKKVNALMTIKEDCIAWCQEGYKTTPYVHDDYQGRLCRMMLGRVPSNPQIHDDCQGALCRIVLGRVPDNLST